MFWSAAELSFESEEILKSDNCTFEKLIGANDILERVKENNVDILEFFTKREILKEMVETIVHSHENPDFSKDQYKEAYISMEIFTCLELKLIAESFIGEDTALLDMFLNFFPLNGPVNPLSASLVCRSLFHLCNCTLTASKIIDHMRKNSFLHRLIGHFDNSAVSDFVCRLLNLESDTAEFAIPWFFDEGAIFKLVNYFSPDFSEDFQDMTATFLDQFFVNLCEHLQMALDKPEDSALCSSTRELLKQLATADFIQPLLDALISKESHLPVNAARVLLALIDKRKKETSFPLGSGLGDFGNVYDLFNEANCRSSSAGSDESTNACTDAQEDPKQRHVRDVTETVYALVCDPAYLAKLRDALVASSEEKRFTWNRVALCQFLTALVSCDCSREVELRKARESASKKCEVKTQPIVFLSQFSATKSISDKLNQQSKPVISDEAKLLLLESFLNERIVKTVMDLITEYSNCTFLHDTMRKLIDCVFVYAGFEHITQHETDAVVKSEEKTPELVYRMFSLTQCIHWLAKMSQNFTWTSLPNVKPGYFGHVLLFVNEIAAFEKECGGIENCASESDWKMFKDLIENEIAKLNEATESVWDTSCLSPDVQSLAMDISLLSLSGQSTQSNIMKIFGENFMQKEFNGPLSFSSFRAMESDCAEKENSNPSDDSSPEENEQDSSDDEDSNSNDSDDKNDANTAPRIIKQTKSDPQV